MSAAFRRQVWFEPGYNYLHETGPNPRGQHGMQMRFLLSGPQGASQFLMFTGWTPLGQVDEGAPHREPCHIDPDGLQKGIFGTHYGLVNAPSGADLGYHWRSPLYEGEQPISDASCQYLGGDTCYYDGSGLAAEDVLRDFIREGERAVWRWLVKRYRWCLEQQAEYEAAINA